VTSVRGALPLLAGMLGLFAVSGNAFLMAFVAVTAVGACLVAPMLARPQEHPSISPWSERP